MNKAILFITFNRLETTKKVFEQIQIAQPPRLYLASDGARVSRDGEKEIVQSVRQWILDNINWDCEVKTLFREENLGCGKNVSGAITWFFENEPDGIILEDDCVPNQSFFSYCEELLDKYKEDKRIWHIAGDAVYENLKAKETYYFAKIMHCWGWATWADRWKHFKFDLNEYDEKNIKKFSKRIEVQEYWLNILDKMKRHEIDTWDYQWTFWIVANDGFCINPYKNLINNIGNLGVHYQTNDDPRLNRKTYSIEKIIHPKDVKYNNKIIDWIYTYVYNIKRKFNIFYKKEKINNIRKITILSFIKIKYKKKYKEQKNLIIDKNATITKEAKVIGEVSHE